MNSASKNLFVGMFFACLLIAPGATMGATLDELFAGQTITAGDKIFSDWTLLDVQTTNGASANTSAIDVTALSDDPLNPGVMYDSSVGSLGTPFGHAGPSEAILQFSYSVQTTSQQPLIKDNSLFLSDFTFDAHPDGPIISISERVKDAGGGLLGEKGVFAVPDDLPGSGNPDYFDSIEFDPQSIVFVETTINIQGPQGNDGAFLISFEQRFSQVPEPATAFLFGLAGLRLLIRRRRTAISR